MSNWFEPAEISPEATLRLFLFPHAGSGATIYKDWPGLLPPSVASQCVQLPGRQQRAGEPAFMEMESLVDALYLAFTAELDDPRPYAFFGHCMGAQLAYRLTVLLERDGRPGPAVIGVSGWAPEGFLTPTVEQAYMPEPELKEWIVNLGSLPADVLENPDLLSVIIPVLRADLVVCSTYRDDAATIACPVVSYSGWPDPLMPTNTMPSWATRTPKYLGNSEFPGGHFYMDKFDNALAVTTDLTRHIQRLAA